MRALTAGKRLQGLDDRLDEKRHEAQPDSVLLLERLFVLGAQVHDPRHVGLVEGREDRGGVLDFDQALGNLLAEPAHALAGFASASGFDTGAAEGARSPGPGRPAAPVASRPGTPRHPPW